MLPNIDIKKVKLGKDLKHVIDEVLDNEIEDKERAKLLSTKILNALRLKVTETAPSIATIFDEEDPDDEIPGLGLLDFAGKENSSDECSDTEDLEDE